MEKLISVIIPTYKRISELKDAILSVENQTINNYEIIVVDDNAEHKEIQLQVKSIVDELSIIYKNISFVVNANNLGGAETRNVGVKNSNGFYVAFLDDDDKYAPNRLQEQYDFFENCDDEKLALLYCYAEERFEHNPRKTVLYAYPFKGNCIYEQMRIGCIAATSQWMVKREVFNKLGGFDDVPSKQDSTFMLKLLVNGYNIDRVEKVLSFYYTHLGERISCGSLKSIEGEILYRKACRKNYSLLNSHQILEIEYAFSTRLMNLYYRNHLWSLMYDELSIMIRLSLSKSIKDVYRLFIRCIKDSILKSIRAK